MSSDIEFLEASAKLVQDCLAETNRLLADTRDPEIRARFEASIRELNEAAARIESERQREIQFLAAVEKRQQIRARRESAKVVVEEPVAVPPEPAVEFHFAMKTRDLLLAEYGAKQTNAVAADSRLDFEDWTQSRDFLQQSLAQLRAPAAKSVRPTDSHAESRTFDSWLQSSGVTPDAESGSKTEREQREWERLLGQ